MSQHKHLCSDKLQSFKIPWWSTKPNLKKTLVIKSFNHML